MAVVVNLWTVDFQQSITSNFTTVASYNAMSAGPISISAGVTVTITAGTTWAIV
jgi:hypothetical protein